MNAPSTDAVDRYPYRLRMEHQGLLSLQLQRDGATVRFDPRQPPDDGDIVALSWAWPEHLLGTVGAFRAGRRPRVVAPQPVLDWLLTEGAPADCLHASGAQLDGVTVQQWPYTPIPWATPEEGVRKLRSALARPDRAVRRLLQHRGLPSCQPQVTRLGLPDGSSLVHLHLALHSGTPEGWLSDLCARLGQPEWLLLGCDYGEDDAVAQRVARFGARHILLVDLLGEVRRSIGMPTALLTPLADQLREQGLDAYVFASNVSYRFE